MRLFLFRNTDTQIEYCLTDTRSGERLPRLRRGAQWQYQRSVYNSLEAAIFGVMDFDAAKRMVEQRLGIAMLPRTAVQAEVGSGRLVPVTVTDMPPVRRPIVVARRRDAGAVSPVLAAFLATLDDLRPSEERSHRFLA